MAANFANASRLRWERGSGRPWDALRHHRYWMPLALLLAAVAAILLGGSTATATSSVPADARAPEVTAVSGSSGPRSASATSPLGPHQLIVLPVDNGGGRPWTEAEIQGAADATAKFWSDQTGGAVTITSEVRPWATIANATCGVDLAAAEAANALPHPADGHVHIVALGSVATGCGGEAGYADTPGNRISIYGVLDAGVWEHEFGHNLGLGHASSCDSPPEAKGSPKCSWMPSEYGDETAIMGGNRGSLGSPHADFLGVLRSARATPGADLVQILTDENLPWAANSTFVHAVTIPVAGGTMYIDYRNAGLGDFLTSSLDKGVRVRWRATGSSTSFAIDSVFGSGWNARNTNAVAVGETWRVPGTSWAVSTLAEDGSTATVRVRAVPDGAHSPTAPVITAPTPGQEWSSEADPITVSWTPATAEGGQPLRYQLLRDGYSAIGPSESTTSLDNAQLGSWQGNLYVRATDSYGNSSVSAPVAVDRRRGEISGHVTASATQLARAYVVFYRDGSRVAFARPGEDGNYRAEMWPGPGVTVKVSDGFPGGPGPVDSATAFGHQWWSAPGSAHPGLDATPIALARGQRVEQINFAPSPAGSIAGRIGCLKANGTTIPCDWGPLVLPTPEMGSRIRVTAVDVNGVDAGASTTYSGTEGSVYALTGLAPGTYRLRFDDYAAYLNAHFDLKPPFRLWDTPQWGPHATTAANAPQVVVRAGEATNVAPAAISGTGTIRGTISIRADRMPFIRLYLRDADGAILETVTPSPRPSDGLAGFVFQNVPIGVHRIDAEDLSGLYDVVSATVYSHQTAFCASDQGDLSCPVEFGSVQDIVTGGILRNGAISGQILGPTPAQMANLRFRISQLGDHTKFSPWFANGGSSVDSPVNPDGSFRVDLVQHPEPDDWYTIPGSHPMSSGATRVCVEDQSEMDGFESYCYGQDEDPQGKPLWVPGQAHRQGGMDPLVLPTISLRKLPPPTGIVATPGDGKVSVSWKAAAPDGGSPVLGYLVTRMREPISQCTTTSALSCDVIGLTNGEPAQFQVKARYAKGTSTCDWSEPIAAGTPPGAPSNLVATPGDRVVSIAFTEPTFNGGADITSYEYSVDNGTTWVRPKQAAPPGPVVITGLVNGRVYRIRLRAVNEAGAGATSQPVSVTPATVPDAPTAVRLTPGNRQLTVAWAAPASDGGAPITGYTATAGGMASCTTTGATSCVLSGLENGAGVTITVTATNAIGTSIESEPSTAVPGTVPDQMGAPRLTSGDRKLTVTWTNPGDGQNGGSRITGYTATAQPGGTACSPTSGADTCDLTGLTNGTRYTVTMTAINAFGTSTPSAPADGIPFTRPEAPGGVKVTPGDSQLTVTWTPPVPDGGSPITGFTAVESGAGMTCSTRGALSCTIQNLVNGLPTRVTVTATNKAGTSPASAPVTATPRAAAPPGPPRAGHVAGFPALGQATVEWLAPAATGVPVAKYWLRVSAPNSANRFGPWIATTSTRRTLTGLTRNAVYWVQLVTVTDAPWWSAPATFSFRQATVPSEALAPKVTSWPGPRQATITWSAPPSNGRTPVTGYRLRVSKPNSTTRFGAWLSQPASAPTSRLLTGLVKGANYRVQIVAVNSQGGSDPATATFRQSR